MRIGPERGSPKFELSAHGVKGLWTRSSRTRGLEMPVWAWILIILLIVFALGGFGYSRR
jgi:hypothetical protein